MKQTISVIILAILGFAVYTYFAANTNVTTEEFRDYRREFRVEIDTLKKDLREVSSNVDTVRIQLDSLAHETKQNTASLDTLKYGQYIIYEEVKRTADKSFWGLFE